MFRNLYLLTPFIFFLPAFAQQIQLRVGSQTENIGSVNNVGQIAMPATAHRVLALDGNGTLHEWQRATGVWQTIAAPGGIRKIAAGVGHTLVLLEDGSVWAAGENTLGQLGDGTIATRQAFRRVANLPAIADIEAGPAHSVAVDREGRTWAWGANFDGLVPSRSQKVILTPESAPAVAKSEDPRAAIAVVLDRQTVTLSASSVQVTAPAGSGNLNVTADEAWTAVSSNSWLTVSPASGATSQALTYSYSTNPGNTARMATITIAGKSFLVSQSGSGGQYTPWGTLRHGTVRTVAGTGGAAGFNGDGLAGTATRLANPQGVALDGNGNVYFADATNHRVRKVDADTKLVSTLAGTGTAGFSGDSGQGASAQLSSPTGAAVDALGNVYIADSGNGRVRKIDAVSNIITTVTSAIASPVAIAVDGARNLFVVDAATHRVMRVDGASSAVTPVAGTGSAGFSGDGGAATAAALNGPSGVAVDMAGNVYIADKNNNRIRKVDAGTSNISTVAGTTTGGYSGDDGPATNAKLNKPSGVAVDPAGNLFIADTLNNMIRKVTAGTQLISRVAGTFVDGFSVEDDLALAAPFTAPLGIAVDGIGSVYVGDSGNNRVRFVDFTTPRIALSPSTPPLTALARSGSITVTPTPSGAPWVASSNANWLALTASTGAGTGPLGFSYTANSAIASRSAVITVNDATITVVQPGAAVSLSNTAFTLSPAAFSVSFVLTVTPAVNWTAVSSAPWLTVGTAVGNGSQTVNFSVTANTADIGRIATILIAGQKVTVIQASTSGASTSWGVSAYGLIRTIAGTGVAGFSGDGGPATSANLQSPQGIVFDSNGNLIFADTLNHRIRRVDAATGIITTIAGVGTGGFSGDGGPAINAQIYTPIALALDSQGNIVFSDLGNNRIRRIHASTGIITTIGGNGLPRDTGDGGLATDASILKPLGVAIDASDNVFLVSGDLSGGSVVRYVRRIDAVTNLISHVAGSADLATWMNSGPAAQIALNSPYGIAFSPAGDLYVACFSNIRKIEMATGQITTVAGSTFTGFSGDGGPATAAQLYQATHIGFDPVGNLFFVDYNNNRVRRVSSASGVITTVVGGGNILADGGPATFAELALPVGVALDGVGNLAVSDSNHHRIRFVDYTTTPVSQQAPVVLAASPAVATATNQTFTITARDANGATDIRFIFFLVNSTPTVGTNTCHGYYDRVQNAFALYSDNLAGPYAPATLNNTRCAIDGTGSFATVNGNDLILTLALQRKGAYSNGALKLYIWPTDFANTGPGWVQASDWNVSPQAPTLAASSPATASLLNETFSFTARDLNGYTDISKIYFLVNADATIPANSCHGYYDRLLNNVFLYNDALTQVNGQNSQCAVNSFTVSNTATDIVLGLTLTRKGSYATGTKTVYAWVTDSTNLGTGWVQASTWNVGGPQAPVFVSAAPTSLNSLSDTFSVTVRDGNGAGDISRIYFLLNVDPTITANGCHGYYDKATNKISIYNDALTAVGPPNSQCAVSSFSTTTTASDLTLTLTMSRLGSYATGTKNFYVWVVDTTDLGSGWQQAIVWNLGNTTPQAPTLVSATPATAATTTQAFTITARDTNGASDIYRIYFLVNSDPSIPANTCHGFYDRALNAVYLYNDSLTALNGQNSQCAVSNVSATTTSTDVILNMTITRQGSYATGSRNLYTWIVDNSNLGTGWQQAAAWTIGNATPQAPTLVSAAPASSTQPTQNFTITARDLNGAADIYRIYFLVNSDPSIPTGTCHGFYDRALNAVYLYNDSLTALNGQNSQCAVSNVSATTTSTDVVLNMTITRQGSYSTGTRNLYTWIVDNGNLGTGWQQAAAWTIGSPQAPTLVSTTPTTTATATQTFTITARDGDGATDISRVYFLINTNPNIPVNSCHGFYDRASNTVSLYNDALSGFTPPNNQCSVGSFSASTSGTGLTLTLTLTRQGSYATGTKNLYLWVTDTANTGTGWVQSASWTL